MTTGVPKAGCREIWPAVRGGDPDDHIWRFLRPDGDSDGQQVQKEGKLESISLPGNDLSRVDDLLLAEVDTNTIVIVFIFKRQALVKMKKANLSDTKLSLKQLQW